MRRNESRRRSVMLSCEALRAPDLARWGRFLTGTAPGTAPSGPSQRSPPFGGQSACRSGSTRVPATTRLRCAVLTRTHARAERGHGEQEGFTGARGRSGPESAAQGRSSGTTGNDVRSPSFQQLHYHWGYNLQQPCNMHLPLRSSLQFPQLLDCRLRRLDQHRLGCAEPFIRVQAPFLPDVCQRTVQRGKFLRSVEMQIE